LKKYAFLITWETSFVYICVWNWGNCQISFKREHGWDSRTVPLLYFSVKDSDEQPLPWLQETPLIRVDREGSGLLR